MPSVSTVSDIVRRRIREIRLSRRTAGGRPWSLDTLARRLLELEGADADDAQVASRRMIVNRLERGERGISLDDWFICAAALGVSPLALLPGEGAVQLAPHLTLPAGLVLAWMRGEGPLRRDDLAVYEANEPARFGFFSDNEQRYYATTSRGSSRDEKEGLLAFIAHERDMLEDMADTFRRVPGHPSGEQHIRDLRARVAAEIAELDELARKVEATTPHRPIPRKPRKKEGKK